jgi:uncharacterized protein
MTPQERQMVADLFDRLASLEGGQRDPDAERVIREGLARAPNAVYALVQTVLLQEEALKRANTRIEELEHAVNPGPAQTQSGGFLDSMRSVFAGQSRGSVPSVRTGGGQGSSGAWGGSPPPPPGYQPQPGYAPPPGYMQGSPMGAPMMGGGGGSFLGTAAAAAAGVIGGSLLLNGIRNAFSAGGSHQTFGGGEGGGLGSSPWGGSGGGGELSREAGVGDIGRRAYDDPPARQDTRQDTRQDAWNDAQQSGLQDDNDNAGDYTDDAGDYSDDGGTDTA